MDEAEVISELYGLPPGDFTGTRNDRAAQARRAGDKAMSERIKALKKPSASAWAINMLVRRHPEEISELLALGARLREAQASLAGDQLRELGRQRKQAVAALAKQARQVSASMGQKLSGAAAAELEDTLQAALVDPSAGYAVRSGRMTAPLSYVGLGPLSSGPDLSEAVAPAPEGLESITADWPDEADGALLWSVPDTVETPPVATKAATKAAPRQAPAPRQPEPDQKRELEEARRKRELEKARDERQLAERTASDAAKALRDAQTAVERITDRRKELDSRVDELHEELRAAEDEAMAAAKEVLAARHDRDAAARADRVARRNAERARAEVERLDDPLLP